MFNTENISNESTAEKERKRKKQELGIVFAILCSLGCFVYEFSFCSLKKKILPENSQSKFLSFSCNSISTKSFTSNGNVT